jgi:group I intron endonuclease
VYIYRITNIINGKQYIGQTRAKPSRRWTIHKGNSIKHRSLVNLAIKKYGESNFVFEVIDEAHSLDELDQKECFYIVLFNSLAPNGYNIESGGQSPKFSEESKRKMRISQNKRTDKRFCSNETRKKISLAQIGKIISETTKKKQSEKRKGISPGNKGTRPIKAESLDGTFVIYFSGSHEIKKSGFSLSSVYACINKLFKQYSGMNWEHV